MAEKLCKVAHHVSLDLNQVGGWGPPPHAVPSGTSPPPPLLLAPPPSPVTLPSFPHQDLFHEKDRADSVYGAAVNFDAA